MVSRVTRDGFGRDRLTGREQDDVDGVNSRIQLRAKLGDLETLFSADYGKDKNNGRTLSSLGRGNDGNRRTSELGLDQSFDRTIWGASNASTLDLKEAGRVVSVIAYRDSQAQEIYSQTGTSYTFLTTGTQQILNDSDHVKVFSTEVRYESPIWDFGSFVAGVYYLNENASRLLGTQNRAAITGRLTGNRVADQHVNTESIAGFVDGTVNLVAGFKLALGGRYTSERKRANLITTNFLAPASSFSTGDLQHRWNQFTPRVVLSWAPTRDVLAYASYSKGFTSGGYNTEANNFASIVTPFGPEKVDNYELGLKATLFDRLLTTNISAFRMEYDGKQEFVQNTLTGVGTILNAAKATSKGIEVELGLHPLRGLDINGTYGFLDTRYDNFVVPGVVNNTGNPLGSSPRNRASGTVNYQTAIGDAGFITANLSYAWTDDYFTGATKSPQLFVPRYGLLNASLAYETPNKHFRIQAWGKNLANKDFLLTPSTAGVLSEYLGAPRTYGVTLTARY